MEILTRESLVVKALIRHVEDLDLIPSAGTFLVLRVAIRVKYC